MIADKHNLIVVTPVYEDVEASSRLFAELSARFKRDVFVVAVDDGSVHQPLSISHLESAGVDGVLLKLRRNVGHQRAIAIGLGYVSEYIQPAQAVVVMDSDGEDLPSTISDLLGKLQAQDVDVVVAQRRSRVETMRFKAFYKIYKLFFSLMTGRAISFGNFMALKAHAVRRLVAMQELSIHVAAAVLASKLRTKVPAGSRREVCRAVQNEFRRPCIARVQRLDGICRRCACARGNRLRFDCKPFCSRCCCGHYP